MTNAVKKVTLEDAWTVIRELGEAQKETDRQFKEQLKETDRQLKEQLKETDRQLKETDRQIRKTAAHFNTQWGQFVESLVEGDLVRQLNQRHIEVHRTHCNSKTKFNGKDYEFDIIAINNNEVVVVEVKTTLTPEYVKDFIDSLKDFKKISTEYADKKIYGAVAYIRARSKSEIYSQRQGLFVIKATGNSSCIINTPEFSPKEF